MAMTRPLADPLHFEFAGLTHALLHWADRMPDVSAVTLLEKGEEATARISFGQLAEDARGIAATLVREGLAGQPLLVPAQTNLDFVRGFYAALFAGAIAVPIATQARGAAAERLRAIATTSGATAMLDIAGSDALRDALPGARRIAPDVRTSDLPGPLDGDRVALLQYTSGSTSDPRGIAITAGNLSSNAEMARCGYRLNRDAVMLSWLPLFHDMGLISLFSPLWSGLPVVLMPPLAFLQKPQRWPVAISRHGATVSGGPNFAFSLCAARGASALPDDVDLSGWSVAFCGSEPVRHVTLAKFAAAFAPAGFRQDSLYPCYGLAEATVFVSGGWWEPDAAGRLVSCGTPAEGSEVLIVGDDGQGDAVDDGEIGEIWIRGPHVGEGYWHDDDATQATFRGHLPGRSDDAPYLRTGDLGMMRNGELYVVGRLKDVLINRGTNIHAADVEARAAASHAALTDMPSAAFSVEGAEQEGVVLVQEVARQALQPEMLAAIRIAIEDAMAAGFGLRLQEVVLVRPGTLPRTASGKIRRGEVRRAYKAGELADRQLQTEGKLE